MSSAENAIKIKAATSNFCYGELRPSTTSRSTFATTEGHGAHRPSGCGKSTLLRCLNRMNDVIAGARIEGEILLDGQDIYAPDMDVVELRKRVGMVFQKSNPFPKSIFDNVAYGLASQRDQGQAAIDRGVVEQSLRGAALWDEVKDRLHESALALSGGQQQRLCIARALAVEPGGAPDGRAVLGARPHRHREDRGPDRASSKEDYTIVIVTHNMQQAARVSDFTALLPAWAS